MPYPIKNTVLGYDTLPSVGIPYYGAIGVNQGGYGLTSSTGFWNGKTPNVSGYVTYSGNGTSSPTMYISTGDTELIILANQLGGGSITTIGAAINYLNTTLLDVVCVNVDCPNIVTTNLFLYYDVGYIPSYPKTGIYLYDLSGLSSAWGLLVNGPTYNSANYGSIVLDGVNDYIQIGSIMNYTSGNFSFSYWVYVTSLTTNQVGQGPIIIYKGSYQVNGYYDQINTDGSVSFITNTAGSSVFSTTAAGVISAGNIYNISYTREGSSIRIYVNGVDVTSTAGTHVNPVSTSNNFYIGSYGGTFIFSNVRIYSFTNYNKKLSANEVLQNYYAGLQKLIPTDNLVLWLDGTNTNTRVITPTKAYDMSGNNYDGTFTNGASLAHRDGGTVFSFDGVDDIIRTEYNGQLGDFTVCVWFKSDNSGNWARLVDKSYSDGLWLGKQYNVPNSWGGGAGPQTTYPYGNFLTLPDGQWNFLVSIRNGSTHTLYGNGITNTVSQACSPVLTSTSKIGIGSWWVGIEYFKGKIGDVRLYSRALTADEVLKMYTATKSRYGL